MNNIDKKKNIDLNLSQASTEELKKELEKRGESVGLSNKEKNAYLEKLKGYVKEMNDPDGEICDSTVHSMADEMVVEILKNQADLMNSLNFTTIFQEALNKSVQYYGLVHK